MAPSLKHRARLGPNVSIDITASFLSLAVTVVAVLLLLCAFARRSSGAVTRRRAARGQFAASCGNPQHKLWRSSNSSPLRTATPQILRVVKGGTLRLNRRTKLCEDCQGKLIDTSLPRAFCYSKTPAHFLCFLLVCQCTCTWLTLDFQQATDQTRSRSVQLNNQVRARRG